MTQAEKTIFQGGQSIEAVLSAFVALCRQPGDSAPFITDHWIEPRLDRLRALLSDPITAEQAEALLDAVEKRVTLNSVIAWLTGGRLRWRVFRKIRHQIAKAIAAQEREQEEIEWQRTIEHARKIQKANLGTFDGGMIAGVPIAFFPDSVREYPDFLSWWRSVGRLNPKDPQGWSPIEGPNVTLYMSEMIHPDKWKDLSPEEKASIEAWAHGIPCGIYVRLKRDGDPPALIAFTSICGVIDKIVDSLRTKDEDAPSSRFR